MLAAAIGSFLIGFTVGMLVANHFAEKAMAKIDRGFMALIGLYLKKEVMSIISGHEPTQ